MAEADEQMEQAKQAQEAGESNRKIALLIAVLALFLSFSETLGKGAQTEAISSNIESSDLWAFYQAKTIRMTQVRTAAEGLKVTAATASDPTAKSAIDQQIDAWEKAAKRFESDPETHEGRKELAEHAKQLEEERDLFLARYHHYELASAAFQVAIVLASATVITGMTVLAWLAGLLGVAGLGMLSLGLYAPLILHLP
jgi:hypothetical protein